MPKYVYLASSKPVLVLGERDKKRRGGRSGPRERVKLGIASNPFQRLQSLNDPKCPTTTKDVKSGAPGWTLELVLGPFASGTHAVKDEWKGRGLSLDALIMKGLHLGHRLQTEVRDGIGFRVWAPSEVFS